MANGVPVGLAKLLMLAVVFCSIQVCIVLKTPRREIRAWLVF
jgi:hypothetical protein